MAQHTLLKPLPYQYEVDLTLYIEVEGAVIRTKPEQPITTGPNWQNAVQVLDAVRDWSKQEFEKNGLLIKWLIINSLKRIPL